MSKKDEAHERAESRTLRALANSQFETIEQVAKASDEEMLMIPNVGKVGLLEIKKAIVDWKSNR